MNLYIGNVSFGMTDDDLRREFEAFGQVSNCKIITDRDTGRSRGFAFVEMDEDSEARAAIEALNGKEIDGRVLRVNEARPREDRAPRRGY